VGDFVREPFDKGDEGGVVSNEVLEAPELGSAIGDGLSHRRHGLLGLLRREEGAQRRRRPLPRRRHRAPLRHLPAKNPHETHLPSGQGTQCSGGGVRLSTFDAPDSGPVPPPCSTRGPSACESRVSRHCGGRERGKRWGRR
jgi:hypothetical protein